LSHSTVAEAGPRLGLSNLVLDPPIALADGFHLVFLRGHSRPDDGRMKLMRDCPEGLEVQERSGGSVPVLVAHNRTDTPILIIAGQLIRGGKQNRGVNADVLVPAKGSIEIPVTCVERGRWSGGPTGRFNPEGIEPHFIRGQKMRDLHREGDRLDPRFAAMQERGVGTGHHADQQAVWRAIEELRLSLAAGSDSTDLLSALREAERQGTDGVRIEEAREHAGGADGVLVFIDGEFVGGDLFGTEGWFGRISDELVRAAEVSHRFARSRRGRIAPVDLESVSAAAETILDGIERGRWKRHRPVGDEQSWRIDHPFVDAAATLSPDGEPLHLLLGTRHGHSAFARTDVPGWIR